MGRNHDVKRSGTPPEALGTDTNSGMGLGCGFTPWVNCYPREKSAHRGHDGWVILSQACTIKQLRHGNT